VGSIHDSLMEIGAKLVCETVDALAAGTATPVPQENLIEDEIKHAPKIFKEDCRINWSRDPESVRNLIRGLSPYPTAWSILKNKTTGEEIQTKIFFAMHAEGKSAASGSVETDGKNYLKVACGNGWLQITDLQIAGKKRMRADEFLRGFQQIGDYRFE
jgi:methionyl-tRNA formyltransferase